jgi:hypothetical protein
VRNSAEPEMLPAFERGRQCKRNGRCRSQNVSPDATDHRSHRAAHEPREPPCAVAVRPPAATARTGPSNGSLRVSPTAPPPRRPPKPQRSVTAHRTSPSSCATRRSGSRIAGMPRIGMNGMPWKGASSPNARGDRPGAENHARVDSEEPRELALHPEVPRGWPGTRSCRRRRPPGPRRGPGSSPPRGAPLAISGASASGGSHGATVALWQAATSRARRETVRVRAMGSLEQRGSVESSRPDRGASGRSPPQREPPRPGGRGGGDSLVGRGYLMPNTREYR